MKLSTARAGFTLIELLVVVCIIGILAALLFPAFGRMIGSAESAKCISNLRQIGLGISMYVGDHDNALPGPLGGGTHAFYGYQDIEAPAAGGRLAAFLQGYISPAVEVGGGALRSDVFICPAYARQMKANGFNVNSAATPLIRNSFPTGGNGSTDYGVPYNAFGTGSGTANPTPPMRLSQVAAALKPGFKMSEVWILKDLDGDVAGSVPSGTLGGAVFANNKVCPLHPVHSTTPQANHVPTLDEAVKAHPGGYRNALFFDFHVGRLSLDDKIL